MSRRAAREPLVLPLAADAHTGHAGHTVTVADVGGTLDQTVSCSCGTELLVPFREMVTRVRAAQATDPATDQDPADEQP